MDCLRSHLTYLVVKVAVADLFVNV